MRLQFTILLLLYSGSDATNTEVCDYLSEFTTTPDFTTTTPPATTEVSTEECDYMFFSSTTTTTTTEVTTTSSTIITSDLQTTSTTELTTPLTTTDRTTTTPIATTESTTVHTTTTPLPTTTTPITTRESTTVPTTTTPVPTTTQDPNAIEIEFCDYFTETTTFSTTTPTETTTSTTEVTTTTQSSTPTSTATSTMTSTPSTTETSSITTPTLPTTTTTTDKTTTPTSTAVPTTMKTSTPSTTKQDATGTSTTTAPSTTSQGSTTGTTSGKTTGMTSTEGNTTAKDKTTTKDKGKTSTTTPKTTSIPETTKGETSKMSTETSTQKTTGKSTTSEGQSSIVIKGTTREESTTDRTSTKGTTPTTTEVSEGTKHSTSTASTRTSTIPSTTEGKGTTTTQRDTATDGNTTKNATTTATDSGSSTPTKSTLTSKSTTKMTTEMETDSSTVRTEGTTKTDKDKVTTDGDGKGTTSRTSEGTKKTTDDDGMSMKETSSTSPQSKVTTTTSSGSDIVTSSSTKQSTSESSTVRTTGTSGPVTVRTTDKTSERTATSPTIPRETSTSTVDNANVTSSTKMTSAQTSTTERNITEEKTGEAKTTTRTTTSEGGRKTTKKDGETTTIEKERSAQTEMITTVSTSPSSLSSISSSRSSSSSSSLVPPSTLSSSSTLLSSTTQSSTTRVSSTTTDGGRKTTVGRSLCLPPQVSLNVSSDATQPTIVESKGRIAVIESNVQTSCAVKSFSWSMNGVKDIEEDRIVSSFPAYLTEGMVKVCLEVEGETACGYVMMHEESTTTIDSSVVTSIRTTITTTIKGPTVIPTHSPEVAQIVDNIAELLLNRTSNGTDLISELTNIKDPDQFMQTIEKVLGGDINLEEKGLTVGEIVNLIKERMKRENSEIAEALAELMGSLANVTIKDAGTLRSVLTTLDNALKGSLAYSLTGEGSTIGNTYGVLYGTIRGDGIQLMSAKCSATVQGNVVYVRGDIRTAQYQGTNRITFKNDVRAISSEITLKDYFITFNSLHFENLTVNGLRQQVKMIGNTQIEPNSGLTEKVNGLTIWNTTFNPFGASIQSAINLTFTTWTRINSGKITIAASPNTISLLKMGNHVIVRKLYMNVAFDGNNVDIVHTNGILQVMSITNNTFSFTIFGGSFDTTVTPYSALKYILNPIRVEGASISLLNEIALVSSGDATGTLQETKNATMMLITGYQDVAEPRIESNATDQILTTSLRPVDSSLSQAKVEEQFVAGMPLKVNGEISTSNAGTQTIRDATIIYDGTRLLIETYKKKMLIEDAKWSLSTSGIVEITITGGFLVRNGKDHLQTILEVGEKSMVVVDGGTILRNASDGYVIMNGRITRIGFTVEKGLQITSQSLMNQDAQQQIINILDNTADFLLTDGKNMSQEDLDAVARSLLSIFSELNKAMAASMANPLESDLLKNLAYEKANYNDIFNALPKDRSKIRYVEEYTHEEWALEATRLVQQEIARQMAARMEKLLGILEDTIVSRMTHLPDTVSYSSEGTDMIVAVGMAKDVFAQDHNCRTWKVVFPSKVEYLNTEDIKDETIIRVSLVCYEINPYAWVDNAEVLVTSGALAANLKTLEGAVILVNQTHDPIEITGKGGGQPAGDVLMLTSEYLDYQILDQHTFRTQQWNSSVIIEITPSSINKNIHLDNTEMWMFVGFQRLPGPYEADHDFKFRISYTYKSSLFISSLDLYNRTGLFYVGIGIRSLDKTKDDDTIADYPPPSDVNGSWRFERSIPLDYKLRSLTKGCFYFNFPVEQFSSSGILTGVYIGDVNVLCKSFHMTHYATGIFTPEMPADFQYTYIEQSFPKSCMVLLSMLLLVAFIAITIWCAQESQRRDESKGQLFVMADNYPLDTYKYILVVDTGYKMFAITDSKIHINLSGEETQALDRRLIMKEECNRMFRWGTSERFLMTTPYPLGKLRYLRIWIDCTGLGHRESWFCQRVTVYDMQTKEETLFEVNNWMGTQNGDGETERLVAASKRPSPIREATQGHKICENIAYISMFTGGGNLWRLRASRNIFAMAVFVAIVTVSFVNVLVAKSEDFAELPKFEKQILGLYFSMQDVIIGILYSFLLAPCTFFLPKLMAHVRSREELAKYLQYQKAGRIGDWKGQGFIIPRGWKPFITTIVFFYCVFLFAVNVQFGFTMNEDQNNAYIRRFFVMLFMWILIVEPFKGLVVSTFYCVASRMRYILPRYEAALIKTKPVDEYEKAPPGERDDTLGVTVAEMAKLERNADQRMRDEQLFETSREVLTFLSSIVVLLGLTYFCRDRNGYYYQQQVRSLFNINTVPNDTSSFMSIQTIPDYYKWTKRDFIPSLRVSWYDDQPAWNMRGFMNDKVSRSMGYGTIRQVRSKTNVNCKIVEKFKDYFDGCEGYTYQEYEDQTEAYTVGWDKEVKKDHPNTRQEYTYRSAEELGGVRVMGNMDYYTAGGYAVDLVGTASDLIDKMVQLEVEGWIDENTRAVIIEFSMYNAQVNYFAVNQLLVECPPDGAMYPSAWIESLRLMKYVGEEGKAVMLFEALYVLFTIVNLLSEVYELFCVGFKTYFTTFWHILGLSVVLSSCTSLYAYGMRYVAITEATDRFQATNGNTNIRLDWQRNLELTFTWLMAYVVFAVSVKMIRILRFNRRISVLALTLEKSASSMAGFAVVYVIINIAFNSSVYVILFNKLQNYRNMLATAETTTASLLGKFSVADVFQVSMIGSIIFMIFMMTGTIILLNMFVMIVMYEFESVRNDKDNQTNDYEVVQHISGKMLQTVGLFERSDHQSAAFPNALEHCRAIEELEKKVNLLLLAVNNMRDVEDEDVQKAKEMTCERPFYEIK